MKNTNIEWCDHTFNLWLGCTKVSPACDNCYAEALMEKRMHVVKWGAGQPRQRTTESNWKQPLKWNREAAQKGIRPRVFCASLADVFDNEIDPQWRIDLLRLIAGTPHLDWLLLTKRIGNAHNMMVDAFRAGWPEHETMWARWPELFRNIWLGATICNQEEADRDIPKLLSVPAHKRFLSIEPLLGPVALSIQRISDWNELADVCGQGNAKTSIDWVIAGGESGSNARPMHPDWVRSLRDQCKSAGMPFLFKQWGEWLPGSHYTSELQQSDGIHGPSKFDSADFVESAGKWEINGGDYSDETMFRVGKKKAGRILDERTWDEVPI